MATIARRIAFVLAAQALSGIATIYFSSPLVLAVLHNAGAALLVLLVTMLNYAAQHQSRIARRPGAGAQSSPASIDRTPHP